MSVEHYTVITCDRCAKERRYEAGLRSAEGDWAEVWPAQATPLNHTPGRGEGYALVPTDTVCLDCLTDDEREQFAEQRRPYEELPF
jgi:hypothetical protein